jgi:hypothetical protein
VAIARYTGAFPLPVRAPAMLNQAGLFQAIANAVLVLHVGYVLFVVLGLVLILFGAWRHWHWVSNYWFRLTHLAAIAVVVVQTWFGLACPLTTLEQFLRTRAGQTVYSGDFIAYWLQKFLFFDAGPIVFIALYTCFGMLVALSWVLVRPVRRHHKLR